MGTSRLDDVVVIVSATLVLRNQFVSCSLFSATPGPVTYLMWFMDDGKLLILKQTSEGADAEASHPGARRTSTVSGCRQDNLSTSGTVRSLSKAAADCWSQSCKEGPRMFIYLRHLSCFSLTWMSRSRFKDNLHPIIQGRAFSGQR